MPEPKLSTTLPKKLKNKPYIPTDDDVKRIMQYAKGTRYEVALMLAAMGGWETPYVMRAVYTHSMEEEQEKAKRKAAEQLKQSILS